MKEKNISINSCNNRWHAEISACRGANIEKLTYDGENVLNPLQNERQWEENPFVYGSPLLLPANRTAGGKFSFCGANYELAITDEVNNANLHGLLYRREFAVADIKSDRAVLRYDNNGEIYPFAFSLTAEYILTDAGIKEIFTVKNRANTDMPYTFALHTSFCEPDSFRVPISLAQEKDSRHIPTGRYIRLNADEEKYISGCDPRGKAISGYYKSNGDTAIIGKYRYTVSEQFDHFVLYNAGSNSGFLCVEPQAGAVNGLNIPGGSHIIAAGGCDELIVSISVSGEI